MSEPFSENVDARLVGFELDEAHGQLVLRLEVAPAAVFTVVARGVKAFSFQSDAPAVGTTKLPAPEGPLLLLSDHPLLWRHHKRTMRVRGGQVLQPEKAALSVVNRHDQVARALPHPWLSLADLIRRLRDNEVLAEVPSPLAQAYMEALSELGLTPEIEEVFWSANASAPEAKLLLLGRHYVIASEIEISRPG